jgi:hypothetical protein
MKSPPELASFTGKLISTQISKNSGSKAVVKNPKIITPTPKRIGFPINAKIIRRTNDPIEVY